MTWLTALILSLGVATSLILFFMIYIGTRNNRKIEDLDKNINLSTSETREVFSKVMEMINENSEQQKLIINRLENLETIVTSDAWEAIQTGDKGEQLGHLLNEEAPEELSSDAVAKTIAKKIKY